MTNKSVNRRNFIIGGLGLASVEQFSRLSANCGRASNETSTGIGVQKVCSSNSEKSCVIPMLYGVPRANTNLELWFGSMKLWGVQRWMAFAYQYRPCYPGQDCVSVSQSVPFLEDAWPGFRPYLNIKALAIQERTMREMEDLSAKNGIEFWYVLAFPIFPVQDSTLVKKIAPQFFKSGRLNLYEPDLTKLLKAEIRTIKRSLPSLKGITLALAEGAGLGVMGNVVGENVEHNKEWELPLISALNEVTQELDMEGIVFAHNYLQTVRSHRNVYEMMANFPQLIIMDDITWPEEDMLHPFLGYLPHIDQKLLFQTNPVALNFLLDTEYIGEGVLPSVYPRWWKYNVSEAVRCGTKIAMGRTFFWDNGRTDVNFNRLNAYMFVQFCNNPEIDARQTLGKAAREMFGEGISERLIDILWETEPMMKIIIGVNGVDSLDHSRFPQPIYLDTLYTPQENAMKAIDDLFSTPGTVLYPPLTDDLNNFKQWRWQNKTVSEPVEMYLTEKKEAVNWVEAILTEVRQLSSALNSDHREMFVHGYEMLAALAYGMELFVETAAIHYQWARAKTLDDSQARTKFIEKATRFRDLAGQVPENPFLYKERMLEFAELLERVLPRISMENFHGDI